jgi:creatinine amidohydrolase
MGSEGAVGSARPGVRQSSLDRLSWPDVQLAAARPGSTVIWPFGAIEQHGPHLPLNTDALFADRIVDAVLERVSADLPIWRLPVSSFGFSPEHRGFPGTLSLGAEALLALVMAVGRDLTSAGFDRLILFNAHGGQIALLQVAARQLRAELPAMAVLPCFLWSGPEGIDRLVPEPERHEGLHAALAETSLMLHLAPELVGKERPHDGQLGQDWGNSPPPGWSLEGAVPDAWLTADLSSSGVIGDARGASAELGEALFHELVIGWKQLLEGLLHSQWPPRG